MLNVLETDTTLLDEDLRDLAAGAEKWASLDLRSRADLLLRTQQSVAEAAEDWANVAVAAKGTPAHLAGEEWMSGPSPTLQGLETMANTLLRMATGASPLDGLKFDSAPGGRATISILPSDAKEWLLLNGFSAEVWLTPGTSETQAKANAGLGARRVGENGGVGLVLGAGNISSIGPLDVLYELVAFNRASILKLNPTFATLLPVYERALKPLIDFGVLRIVNGAAATGGYLADHPAVKHVHITGSAVTHDAIVWGVGDEAATRKAANDPRLGKEMTSELGGVSPVIVVPGKWSKADLRFQAEHVATMRLHNAGHNCIGGQMLILSSDWPQREAFLGELAAVMDNLAPRSPWYPNAQKRIDDVAAHHSGAERHGDAVLAETNYKTDDELFTTECFAGVLGHTSLPGTGAEFLRAAVAFSNDRLAGTLGGNIIVKPRDRKKLGSAFDEAIADFRYGGIGINVWSGIVFLLSGAPWGAYPGHTLDDVGSGIGVVHNAHLIDGAEKVVATGPFRPFPRSYLHGEFTMAPRPPWFVTAKTSPQSGRALTEYGAKRTWWRTLKVVPPAMRG